MRAGRTITSQNRKKGQTPGQVPASSYYAGLACLLGILWLSAAPMLAAAAGCGVLPHDHLLLGGAGAPELIEHMAEESACAAGHTSADAADAHSTGTIISVFHIEPEPGLTGGVLSLDQVALVIPALMAAGGLLTIFVWRLSVFSVMGRSLLPSPVDPPPESAGPPRLCPG